jgi:uncharacterized protein (TIGR03083 family)
MEVAMPGVDVWPTVFSERRALAHDLASLSEAQWSTPSLCSEWTVRDVLAHMTGTAKITPGSFFPKFVGSGFSFGRLQAKSIAEERGVSGADTLTHFEGVINSEKRPPGGKNVMLGETIVHAEDIRRSLGLRHDYPTDALVEVADFYKRSNFVMGSKRRIDGVALRATDAKWSNGTGPEVSGPMVALLMALTGRKAALDELSGEGVATLRERP